MLYTLISFLIIIIILLILTKLKKSNSDHLILFSYLSKQHTNIIKGIATLLIILSHIANFKGLSVLIPLGGIGVAIFMLSSGYGLNESFQKNGLNHYFKKRVFKILIPYWMIIAIYSFLHFEDISIKSILGALILINRLPFMWFIQYILMWYLIFYFSKKLFSDTHSVIVLIIISLIFVFVFHDTTWGEQSFSFSIGVILSQYKKIREYLSIIMYHKSLILFLFMSILFSTIFLGMKMKGLDNINYYWVMNIIQILMKISLAIFIIQVTYFFKKYSCRALILVGSYSYELYLIHTLLIDIIKNDDNYFFLILFFVLVMFFTIVINKLSNLIERSILKRI